MTRKNIDPRIQAAADVLAVLIVAFIIVALSVLIVFAFTYGICWCFGLEWRVTYALGAYLLLVLLKQFVGGK